MEFFREIDLMKKHQKKPFLKISQTKQERKDEANGIFFAAGNQWQRNLILKFVPDALHRAGINSCALPAGQKAVTQS